jgi:DSF synthase
MAEVNPVSYEELSAIVNIWVDTALQLSNKNMRLMEYLLDTQNKRWNTTNEKALVAWPRPIAVMSSEHVSDVAA